METKKILDDIKCPVCLEVPPEKIFLCVNGHLICDTCSISIKECPQCRHSFQTVKVRNRVMEVLLDTMKFDCVFQSSGCPEKIGRNEISSHSVKCQFNGKQINFCGQLGYICDFKTNLLDVSPSLVHYKTKHKFLFRDDLHFCIQMSDFKSVADKYIEKYCGENTMWTPVVVQGPSIPSTVVVLSLLHAEDCSISLMCVQLSENSNSQTYHVLFTIESNTQEVPDISWRSPAIDVNQVETANLMVNSPIRIPMDFLNSDFIDQDGDLVVAVKIIPFKVKGKKNDVAISDAYAFVEPVNKREDHKSFETTSDINPEHLSDHTLTNYGIREKYKYSFELVKSLRSELKLENAKLVEAKFTINKLKEELSSLDKMFQNEKIKAKNEISFVTNEKERYLKFILQLMKNANFTVENDHVSERAIEQFSSQLDNLLCKPT